MHSPARVSLMLLIAAACGGSSDTDVDAVVFPTPGAGDGVFADGCPPDGQAVARVIGVDARLPGETAVGTAGDLLLANDAAAFVISDAVGQSTYWYYGGALVDAVPMDGCVAGPDRLDDLGFVLAELDLGSVEQSVVRGFRADTVEVVADGSDGGAAIVRATGVDDVHWLVEHELIKDAADKGGRPFSEPFGVAITVDYVLAPDSPVLQIDITVANVGDTSRQLFDAALISYGDTMTQHAYSTTPLELGGFGFDAGIPWVSATDGAVAYAWSAPQAALAGMSIAGVNILADVTQVTNPGFGLDPGDTHTFTRFFTVAEGPGGAALRPTLAANPQPTPDAPPVARTVSGQVVDPAGAGVPAELRVEARAPGAEWGVFDVAPTAADGTFVVDVPAFEDPWEWRLTPLDAGRDDPEPVEVAPGDQVTVPVAAAGVLRVTLTDGVGAPSPGRLHLSRDDGTVFHHWLGAEADVPVPPGSWSWTVTRGYEYAPVRGQVVVPADGGATVVAVLEHVVDTTGWVSADTHVHSSDSPDSDISPVDQLRHAAAHGLDIVIRTEHENIVDRSGVPAAAGLDAWLGTVTGEEVTSVAVEHMTMFPAEPDGSPRGGYVEWYGLDIAELFDAMKARSDGGVNLLNHPGYLDRIGWDRVTAQPTLDDPSLLGFTPDDALWSWNLDGIEVMNGHGDPFVSGKQRFDNWMSMVNAGHRVVGVGCSDDHHGGSVGFPRTYARSATDVPSEVTPDALADAFLAGQVMASAGGFARVDIDGHGPGALLTAEDGLVELDVHLEALPEIDVTHFVVFVNCDQADSVLATDPDALVKHVGSVPLALVGDSQIVIAAFGTTNLADGLPQYDATVVPRVLTSPIYVDVDGDGRFSAPGGRECSYDLGIDAAS